MTDEEKHMEVMVAISKINTKIEERIIPAVEQVWNNKDDIIRIQGRVRLGQWIGGAVGMAFISTVIRSVYAYVTKHPPPTIPH